MIVLCGMAGVGKSFFSYHLANALATGSVFIDAPAPLCRVLYCDEENSRADLAAYARWTWRGLGSPSRDLLRENMRIESRTLGAAAAWGVALRQLAAAHRPQVIIIDTATPACHIMDENSNAEAAAATQQLRLAQDAGGPDCVMILLKHLRLDHQTGRVDLRGAKHWKGAVDSIWYHLFRPGPRRTDGWRNTFIRPEKSRAYGLRDNLIIRPRGKLGESVSLDLTLEPPVRDE